MNANETSGSRGWYMHADRAESQQLKGRVVAQIAKHPNDDNMHCVLDGEETAGGTPTEKAASLKKANRQLYGLLIDQIKNPSLVEYLQEHHENKGKDALDYVMGCFGAGADENKLEAADNRYKQIEKEGIPASATTDEANALLTELSTIKSSLDKVESYKMSNARHSRNLVRMVRMRGPAYRDELRHQKDKLDVTTLENVVRTAGILDGIMRNVASQLAEDAAEEEKPRLMWANKKRDGDKAEACKFCGIAHYGKECYAKMLTEGRTPPRWDEMAAEQRKRIAARAEKKTPGCTANVNVLICAMPASVKKEVGKVDYEMLVDTQAAPGHDFHFIKDAELMCQVKNIEGGQPITGVGSEMVIGKIGSAMFRGASGEIFMLHNCLHDPRLPENLINPSYIRKQGGLFDSANLRLITAQEKIIDLSDSWTFTAQAVPQELKDSVPVYRAATVQRGSHGKLHIEVDGLRGKQRAEFELTSARYNDPSLGRMRTMPDIADGVSPIVRKANAVNTAGVTRMLADVPTTDAPRAGSTPEVGRSGAQTCIDLWKAPCKSLEGNVYMNSAYDVDSTHFEVYPLKSKDQAPQSVDQHFTEAKARGVDFDSGGVLYRDNEIVLNSARMNGVAAKHGQANKNSIEYEPTGNAGVESVFRILPHEMRKNAIRSGMPDEFWDHNAVDCAELMAATRCREQPDGTMVSVGEKFDGKRRSLSKRRVWGCLVVAKKYPTKVAGKLDDRGVIGVNLGRSRKRPGYNIWTPEYGVFTSKHVVFYETEFPFKDGTFALQRRSTGGGATAEGGGGGFTAPTAQPTAEDDESVRAHPQAV